MGLKFKCPHCQKSITVFDLAIGEQTVCGECKKEITIPTDPRMTEHIHDPDTEMTSFESDTTFTKPRKWLFKWYWSLAMASPLLVGLIIVVNFVLPRVESQLNILFGITLVISFVLIFGLLYQYKWSVWGTVAFYCAAMILSIVEMRWEIFLYLLFVMFIFYLIVRSEWEKLR